MKIKYIRTKEKESVCDYWLMTAYILILRRNRKSRARKKIARKIIRICKGRDKRISDIADDYRFWTAKTLYDNVVNK